MTTFELNVQVLEIFTATNRIFEFAPKHLHSLSLFRSSVAASEAGEAPKTSKIHQGSQDFVIKKI